MLIQQALQALLVSLYVFYPIILEKSSRVKNTYIYLNHLSSFLLRAFCVVELNLPGNDLKKLEEVLPCCTT